jgi:hypothetical protein
MWALMGCGLNGLNGGDGAAEVNLVGLISCLIEGAATLCGDLEVLNKGVWIGLIEGAPEGWSARSFE